MIIKPRTTQLDILVLEATLRRLPETHDYHHIAKGKLNQRKAGYRGEKAIDYYLADLKYTHPQAKVIQDLRLKHHEQHFQMDTIILTRHLNYIIEGKDFCGHVKVDPFAQQMIRTIGDTSDTYTEPTTQLNRTMNKLTNWFDKEQLVTPPITGNVCFTNEHMQLETTATNQWLQTNTCRPPGLLSKFTKTYNQYTDAQITESQLEILAKKLIQSHEPRLPSYKMAHYFHRHDLKRGVVCSTCCNFSMIWTQRSWHCQVCKWKSKHAHNQAITDYALLISDRISNKQLREFLNLHSRHTAYKILKNMKLSLIKGTSYFDLKPLLLQLK